MSFECKCVQDECTCDVIEPTSLANKHNPEGGYSNEIPEVNTITVTKRGKDEFERHVSYLRNNGYHIENCGLFKEPQWDEKKETLEEVVYWWAILTRKSKFKPLKKK